MKKNFDCTQMLSFDRDIVDDKLLEDISGFKSQGFDIFYDKDIWSFKKEYFNILNDKFLVELKDDNFSSEFDSWEFFDKPPIKIVNFSKMIVNIMKKNKIKNIDVYIVFFATPETSKTAVISCDTEDILKGFFNMSLYCYDIFVENMILNVRN